MTSENQKMKNTCSVSECVSTDHINCIKFNITQTYNKLYKNPILKINSKLETELK